MTYLSNREKELAEANALIAAELQQLAAMLTQDLPINTDNLNCLIVVREKARLMPKHMDCHHCQELIDPDVDEHVIMTTHSIVHSDGTVIQPIGEPARLAICACCWGKTGA